MARRVVLVLLRLLSHTQIGYVSDRRMVDSINALLAALEGQYEVVAEESLESPCVVLLDLEKAYDTLSRRYLQAVREAFHFPAPFVRLVLTLHIGR